MSGVKVREHRTLPFFPVTKAETARLAEVADSRSLPYLRSLYFALLEFANDHRGAEVAASRAELAARAGVSPATVKRLTPALVDAGLVHVEEVAGYPSVWTVLGVDPGLPDPGVGSRGPGGSGHADPGVGSASMGGSGLLDPTLNETGQEGKKESPTDSLKKVWEHYLAARKKANPRSNGCKLSDVERRLIRNALKVRDIEDCCAAIDGLFRSQYHLDGGFIGIKYALRGGGNSPDPAATIDRLANGRGSGGSRLKDRLYRGLAWDELTENVQRSVKEAASMGLEVWDGGKDAWADREEREAVELAAFEERRRNGNGHAAITAETWLDD